VSRNVHVAAEYAPADFFGRFDLRLNRLMKDLFQRGLIDDETAPALSRAIGRQPSTVGRWLNYESFPNSVSLVKLAQKFDVDINWICGLRSNAIEDAYTTTMREAA